MNDDVESIKNFKSDGKVEGIIKLEKQLQRLKERRAEEHFMFVIILMLFHNIIMFAFIPNLIAPIAILVLELLLLFVLAYRLRLKHIIIFIHKIIPRTLFDSNKNNGE